MSLQRSPFICPRLESDNIVKALFRKFWHWKRINLVFLGKRLERGKALARHRLACNVLLIRKIPTTAREKIRAELSYVFDRRIRALLPTFPSAAPGPEERFLAFRFCFFARSLSETPAKTLPRRSF